jgi:HK97 family phage major capsid protein
MTDEQPITGPPVKLPIAVCRTQSQIGELRKADGDSMPTMSGHFSVFDDWYEINSAFEGEFMERIAPGAFKKTFQDDASRKNAGDKIKCILEHGHDFTVGDKPLGVPRSLGEDATGAAYDVPLLDTSYVRDLVPALDAGAYGASFRFRVMIDEWNEKPERSEHNPHGIPERTIKEVRVMEFGPTMFPASSGASASLRSTTDDYYAAVRSRKPEEFADVVRSVREVRGAAAPVVPERVIPAAPEAETLPADSVPEPVRSDADDRVSYADGDQPLSTPEGAAPKAAERTTETAPKKISTPADMPGAAPRKTTEPSTSHSAGVTSTLGNPSTRSAAMPADDLTMTVDERVQRQAEIRTRLAEMDAEYNGSVLPDEQQEEWDRISTEFDVHTVAVRAATARSNRIAALASTDGSTETGTPFHTPNVIARKSAENIYDLTALRRDARNMDDLARGMRDNALRAVELNHYDSSSDETEARSNVDRLLRRVDDKDGTLARRILTTGSPAYDRAFGKVAFAGNTDGLNNEERAALAVGATTTGGFAVPFSLDPTVILTDSGVVNPVRQISRVVQIVGKQWQGVTSAGITVSRAAEAAEAGDNAPTIAQPTVTPTRVQGFVPFSFEIDQDWSQMRGELATMFSEAKDTEEATSFVTGSGVDPNPEGVVTGVAAVGASVIQAVTVAGIAASDLYLLVDALPPRHVANASWLGNKSIYNRVRQLDVNGGANLWARLADGRPSRLIDFPVYEASTMNTTMVDASELLLLGDFKKFLIVDRIGMSVELIPHLFHTGNNRPSGQRGMYAVWRNSSKVLDPNAFRVLTGNTA